jgi:predicted transcriptional regulator
MPRFYIRARVTADHLLAIAAPTLAAAKRKVSVCVIPGIASRYTAVLYAGSITTKLRKSSKRDAEAALAKRLKHNSRRGTSTVNPAGPGGWPSRPASCYPVPMSTTLDPDTERLAQKLAAETGQPVEAVIRDAIEAHADRKAKLAKLREELANAVADPRRYTMDEVSAHLAAKRDELAKEGF